MNTAQGVLRKIALARLPDGVRVAFGVRPAGVLAAWRSYRLAIRWLPHQQILCSRSEVDTVASSRLESHSDHLTSANPILLPCAHDIGYLSNTACLHGRPIPTRRFRPPLIMTHIAIHAACCMAGAWQLAHWRLAAESRGGLAAWLDAGCGACPGC